jgi:hypothetical protein
MSIHLPSFANLPHRWRVSDARVVLTALATSGLTAAEFARRTGIPPKRLSRWSAQLNLPAPVRRGPGRPRKLGRPPRLVELVPAAPVTVVPAPVTVVPAPASVDVPALEVRTPGGWQLRIPGELLGELVSVLAARSC